MRSLVAAGGHGPELLELAEASLDGVALVVPARIEDRRPAAGLPTVTAMFFWSSLTGITALMPWRRSQARLAAAEQALPAIARPGRCRGRPFPRRRRLMASISGMNRGESPCWPGLVSRATGAPAQVSGQGESWWSARPGNADGLPAGFLVIRRCPRTVISGRDTADPGPHAGARALRQVPPRAARPGAEEDPVDYHPVICPPPAARRIGRQEHPQVLPFFLRQVMAIQAIKHPADLHDSAAKTHGTRPSPR
jgi:hypothetical protein